MAIIQLKLAPWDKIFEFNENKLTKKIKKNQFKIGDKVIAKIDSRTDLAEIINILEEDKESKDRVVILRKANSDDLEKMKRKEKEKDRILKKASEIVNQSSLPIKLVDAHLSFDGGKIVFAFISPERVDFRNLVKDLSKEFHKSIRMHQINPREEMRFFSSFGSCGRKVCCLLFLKTLGGVTTDLIRQQDLVHRGIERLSGLCGRLKCCLTFEMEIYKELAKKFPPLGEKVETEVGVGEVINWHILKGSIDLKIGEDKILEVPIEKLKHK